MGRASTDNLLAAIAAAKGRPLSRVLCALGVRGTGRSMSRRIARHFATMDTIRAADAQAMQQVEGIGTEKVPSIVAEPAELAPLLDKLAAAGVNMTEPAPPHPPHTTATPATTTRTPSLRAAPLAGMTVVVTGAMTGPLAKLSRNQMNELIEQASGRFSSSISKKTTLVVAGDGAGSKRAKAEDLGIRLTTPDEFAALIADYLNQCSSPTSRSCRGFGWERVRPPRDHRGLCGLLREICTVACPLRRERRPSPDARPGHPPAHTRTVIACTITRDTIKGSRCTWSPTPPRPRSTGGSSCQRAGIRSRRRPIRPK
jgi:Helix-hairpin-helix motif/BRCA1 C Terminus (BRCT) domain